MNGPLEYILISFGLTCRGLRPLDPQHVAQLDEEQSVVRTLGGCRPLPTSDESIDCELAG
jgi:hypothetical protein